MVRHAMQERRILESDIEKVVKHVSETGQYIKHGTSGRCLASFRPVSVTYWIEFTLEDAVYTIHNTWSHRMNIIPPSTGAK